MLDVAIKLLKKIEDNGFQAYIVGGFVRDYVLGITSNDIDICTNAKPKDIRSIFRMFDLKSLLLEKNIHIHIIENQRNMNLLIIYMRIYKEEIFV